MNKNPVPPESLLRWDINDFGWRVEFNNKLNYEWIKQKGLAEESKSLADIEKEGIDITNSEKHETGWLRNIDRLIDMLPLEFDPACYHLLDVGCGSGISTLYFADNYNFMSYKGFDFSPNLIEAADRNKATFNQSRIKKLNMQFSIGDANNWKCSKSKTLIYMFNPFKYETAGKFFKNNIQTFRENNCIFAFAWDTWIETLASENLHKTIIRNAKYKLSLVLF